MERIVVVGHSCVDLIPQLPDDPRVEAGAFVDIGPLTMQAGGSVVNTGSALIELGVPVRLVTTVGDDDLGAYLRAALAELSGDHVIRVAEGAGTSYSLVLEHGGTSRTIWHHVGSAAAFTGAEVDPTDAAIMHLGYPTALPGVLTDDAQPLHALLKRASAAGATRSVDLSTLPSSQSSAHWPALLGRLLPAIDVITPSADDLVSLGWLAERPDRERLAEAAHRLLAHGAAVAMVSDGPRGAYLCTADAPRLRRGGRALEPLAESWSRHAGWIDAHPVKHVVTTNGAGDTATAGLLYGILNRYAPAEAGRSAAALAARRIAGLRLVDPTTGLASAGTG